MAELDIKRHYGIYRGVVTTNSDPENLNRIKVTVPQLTGDAETNWVYPFDNSYPYTPAVNSGVWIQFEAGDPSYPVWSGSFGTPPTPKEVGVGSNHYGSFYSTINQSMVSTTAGQAVKFDTVNINNGIRIASNGTALTRITFDYSGVYRLGFAAQLSDSSNGSAIHDVSFWLVKNGSTALATSFDTNVTYQVPQLTNWTYQIQATAGDYYEIFWHASTTAVSLVYSGALTNPTRPSYPSAFIDISQVR